MAELYGSIERLPGGPHIRLLKLLPSSSFDDEVQTNLSVFPLEALPKYEALSYVWGDTTVKIPIRCNDVSVSITENLLSALKHLRLKDELRILWVDAICINQIDLSERESQVVLMGRIYASSETTLVWLGEASSSTEDAIALCTALSTGNPTGYPFNDSEGHRVLQEEERHCFMDIVRRPWWTRVWVVQEVCLSQKVALVIGSMTMPWDVFDVAVMAITDFKMDDFRESMSQALQAAEVMRLLFVREFFCLLLMRFMRDRFRKADYHDELLTNLVRFREFDATDSRDKIYALLGLTNGSETLIRPDYTTPTGECYKNIAFSIISTSRNLLIFNISSFGGRSQNADLPSWAFDWSSRLPNHFGSSSIDESLYPFEQDEKLPIPFNASGHSHIFTVERNGIDSLCLKGLVIGSIVALEKVMRAPQIDTDTSAPDIDNWSDVIPMFGMIFGRIGRNIHELYRFYATIDDWKRFGQLLKAYPTGEPPMQVLCVTISRGVACRNIELYTTEFLKAWRARAPGFRFFRTLMSPFRRWFPRLYEFLVILPFLIHGAFFPRAGLFLAIILSRATERRLARTHEGYLALVPESAQVGDCIALLPGGMTPYVIRANGLQWELVGGSYVHGIMFGEAWSDENCHEMEFV